MVADDVYVQRNRGDHRYIILYAYSSIEKQYYKKLSGDTQQLCGSLGRVRDSRDIAEFENDDKPRQRLIRKTQ